MEEVSPKDAGSRSDELLMRSERRASSLEHSLLALTYICAAATLILAVIGWPLPPVPTRGAPAQDGQYLFETALKEWMQKPGWRYSSLSLSYLGMSVFFILISVRRIRHLRPDIRFVVLGLPPLGVALAGLAIPTLIGVPWTNYDTGDDPSSGLLAGLALGVFGFCFMALLVQEETKRRRRNKKDLVRRSLDRSL